MMERNCGVLTGLPRCDSHLSPRSTGRCETKLYLPILGSRFYRPRVVAVIRFGDLYVGHAYPFTN